MGSFSFLANPDDGVGGAVVCWGLVCYRTKNTGGSFVRDPHSSGDGLCVAELLVVTVLGKPCL